ncbi:MAG: RNA 2',3'-cyclic phosphodiesterase [Actinomycetota bacterium]|nr:RNA 2',3'-cyclic phosphodiesterase [Actinomycetota bacterium]
MNLPASVAGRDRLRLFCALRLPEPAVDELVGWQQRVFGEVERVRPLRREQLHLTLAFLGSRPVEEAESIAEALREAAAAASVPALRIRRYRETRSVGMLVLDDEDGRAAALAADLHERLEGLGVYEREKRPWLPHATVVRFRERPRLDPPLPDLGEVSPSEGALYHSVLRPAGAQYDVLDSVALGR